MENKKNWTAVALFTVVLAGYLLGILLMLVGYRWNIIEFLSNSWMSLILEFIVVGCVLFSLAEHAFGIAENEAKKGAYEGSLSLFSPLPIAILLISYPKVVTNLSIIRYVISQDVFNTVHWLITILYGSYFAIACLIRKWNKQIVSRI